VTIDLSPEIEARLKAKTRADGISVGEYVERLVSEEESRGVRIAARRAVRDQSPPVGRSALAARENSIVGGPFHVIDDEDIGGSLAEYFPGVRPSRKKLC
jgi:hypothetical protein